MSLPVQVMQDRSGSGLERAEVLAPKVIVNAQYSLPYHLYILGLNAAVRVLSSSVPKYERFLVNSLVWTFSLCYVMLC